MKFLVCAVGHRMPAWVSAGFEDYARRMPREMPVELIEIRPEQRLPKASAAQNARIMAAEAVRIHAALPPDCLLIALDERGKSLTTAQFARLMEDWRQDGRDVAFVIGGADGLDSGLKKSAGL